MTVKGKAAVRPTFGPRLARRSWWHFSEVHVLYLILSVGVTFHEVLKLACPRCPRQPQGGSQRRTAPGARLLDPQHRVWQLLLHPCVYLVQKLKDLGDVGLTG